MDHKLIISQLGKNAATFNSLFNGIDRSRYLWKPAPEKWCLLEVVCHLVDEEREDFRARVKQVLERPSEPMPSIDPVGWVTTRKYMDRDYEKSISDFLEERRSSVTWLRSLSSPPWHHVHEHPKLGSMSAERLLANWLAHDYLHFRQIASLHYGYLEATSGQDLSYAGNW